MTQLLLRLPLYEISVLFCFFLVTEVHLIYNAVSVSSVAVVQPFGRVQLFATPWTAPHQASLSLTNSRSLLKPMSIELVMPSNHLCLPFLLLPSVFPSINVFPNELVPHIRWPKYWNFSFGISPFNEYLWLISFRIDWFDLLPVQGTLKSLLLHQNSKAPLLYHAAFYMVQYL